MRWYQLPVISHGNIVACQVWVSAKHSPYKEDLFYLCNLKSSWPAYTLLGQRFEIFRNWLKMPDFSRVVSTFRSTFVEWRSQVMRNCLNKDYDLMNNRIQFYSMCECVYAAWRVRNVGNSFILPSMKAHEKSQNSKNRQFFKTLHSLQALLASFQGLT